MELKAYIQILLKKWWIVLPVFLVTLTVTVVLTYTEIPIYRSSATFIIGLGSSVDDVRDTTNVLGLLSSREAIGGTYAEIAQSQTTKQSAVELLGLDSIRGYPVSSKILAGSNILEITVEGPNPAIVRDLANAVGAKTIENGGKVYPTYILSVLDPATLPTGPISPVKSRNLLLGAVFGLILGGGLAFLSEYLTSDRFQEVAAMNIMDVETGAYNKRYFLQRLNQEMIRAKRNRYPLSMALIRIEKLEMLEEANNSLVRNEFLRQLVGRLNQYLREEDLLAYLEDNTFAILLLDTSGENAKSIVEYFQTRIAWTDFNSEISDIKLSLASTAGVVTYNHNGIIQEEFIAQARRALQLAAVSEHGRAHLASDIDNHVPVKQSEE